MVTNIFIGTSAGTFFPLPTAGMEPAWPAWKPALIYYLPWASHAQVPEEIENFLS